MRRVGKRCQCSPVSSPASWPPVAPRTSSFQRTASLGEAQKLRPGPEELGTNPWMRFCEGSCFSLPWDNSHDPAADGPHPYIGAVGQEATGRGHVQLGTYPNTVQWLHVY